MLLRQIRYFVMIVQKNSFTEAAEECFISQSAISQQMQALEKTLGVALLVRQGRRFALTKAGEHFYRRSLAILDDIESLRAETRRVGSGDRQALRIGSLRSWGGAQLRQAVAALSAAHPEIDLTLMTGTHEELYEALQQNTIDIAFNDHRRVFSEQYVNRVITSACTCAELSAQSPLASRRAVEVNELREMPCVLVAPRERQSHEQDYYQATLGFGGTFVFAEDLEAARILVAANRGFLPIEGVEGLPENGGAIRRVPIVREGRQIAREYCLSSRTGNDLPACGWFADFLKAQF